MRATSAAVTGAGGAIRGMGVTSPPTARASAAGPGVGAAESTAPATGAAAEATAPARDGVGALAGGAATARTATGAAPGRAATGSATGNRVDAVGGSAAATTEMGAALGRVLFRAAESAGSSLVAATYSGLDATRMVKTYREEKTKHRSKA
jgi:hypothetical protein